MLTAHIHGTGSTGFARDIQTVRSVAAAKAALRDFAEALGASPDSENPAAWADVHGVHADCTVDACFAGDFFTRLTVGPRGGVRVDAA